jgi:hypothetical protein
MNRSFLRNFHVWLRNNLVEVTDTSPMDLPENDLKTKKTL